MVQQRTFKRIIIMKIKFIYASIVLFAVIFINAYDVSATWWNYSECEQSQAYQLGCWDIDCTKIGGSCYLQECDPEKPNDNICWGTKTCRKTEAWDQQLWHCGGAPPSWYCNGSSTALPNGDSFLNSVNCNLSGSFQNCTEVSNACYSSDCGGNCTTWDSYSCWVIRCDPGEQF